MLERVQIVLFKTTLSLLRQLIIDCTDGLMIEAVTPPFPTTVYIMSTTPTCDDTV